MEPVKPNMELELELFLFIFFVSPKVFLMSGAWKMQDALLKHVRWRNLTDMLWEDRGLMTADKTIWD